MTAYLQREQAIVALCAGTDGAQLDDSLEIRPAVVEAMKLVRALSD